MKISLRIVTLIIYLVLFAIDLLADEDGQGYLPSGFSIVPTSPEVGELIEYSEFGVDYHSGLPQISFNLYTIKSGDLELPITLSYKAGGIKSDFNAINYGLGWFVTSMATIGRTVVGLPDECYRSNVTGNNTITGMFRETEEDKKFRQRINNTKDYFSSVNVETFYDLYKDYREGATRYYWGLSDCGNDICNLAGLGLSATMVGYLPERSTNATLHTTAQGLTIDWKGSLYPARFTVRDIRGNSYFFGDTEESGMLHRTGNPVLQSEFTPTDTINYISAWHISKIKNISGDSIGFKYENGVKRVRGGVSCSESYPVNPDYRKYIQFWHSASGSTMYTPKIISEISGGGTTVKFVYSNTMAPDKSRSLEKICVYHDSDLAHPAKTFTFHYSKDGQFLNAIKLNGESLYSFDYYSFWEVEGKDFGGYPSSNPLWYAGIPKCPAITSFGDDLSVTPKVAMHNCIKSIVYPTGGKVEFEWESNDYAYVNGNHITTTINKEVTEVYKTDTLCGLNDRNLEKLEIKGFTVSEGVPCYIDLSNYFMFDPTILYGSDYSHTHSIDLNKNYPHIEVLENGKCIRAIFLDDATISSGQVLLAPGKYDIVLKNRFDVTLKGGYSLAEIFTHPGFGGYIIIQTMSSSTSTSTSVHKDYWPGVRIRRIQSYFHKDSPPLIKDFFYHQNGNETSGVVQQLPNFMHQYYFVHDTDYPVPTFQAFSQVYVMTDQGLYTNPVSSQTVEYAKVGVAYSTEVRDNAESYIKSHKEWYDYSTAMDPANRDTVFYAPFKDCQPVGQKIVTSRSHRRGLLMRHIANEQAEMYPRTTYKYNIWEPPFDSLPVFNTSPFLVSTFLVGTTINGEHLPQNPNLYSVGRYTLIPSIVNIKSETYLEENFETKTSYGYFFDAYTTDITSGLRKFTKIEVPGEHPRYIYHTYKKVESSSGAVAYLPEIDIEIVNGVAISGKRIEYYPNSDRIKATYTLSQMSAVNVATIHNNYSASGNIINLINRPEYQYRYENNRLCEISYRGRVLASYKWGYDNMYPVIEARGLSYDSLCSLTSGLNESNYETIFSKGNQYDLSIYKWQPIIGVVEMCDSRGNKTSYTYDKIGRLSTTSDFNGFLISKHEYLYK